MNSLNSWLLSVFVKDQRFGADIESLRIRVQNLLIIYVIFLLTSASSSLISWCSGPLQG